MKTSQLIAILAEKLDRHGDLEVRASWEGIDNEIYKDGIYKSKCGQLFIDCEGLELGMYKRQFAEDPNETSLVDAPSLADLSWSD